MFDFLRTPHYRIVVWTGDIEVFCDVYVSYGLFGKEQKMFNYSLLENDIMNIIKAIHNRNENCTIELDYDRVYKYEESNYTKIVDDFRNHTQYLKYYDRND